MRLLLAEDEQALSKALKAILERAGYTVDAVNDGKAALDCLDTGSYDGAVLDIMMPVLDGLEVLRQLRARGELLARVRAMTRARTAQTGSRLRLGNIMLDRATYELSSPTGSFRLSSREFQMLEMLLCSPGHILPEARFLERIWGQDGSTERSVVWVYISYLQNKLKALHADIRIRAVRGEGYVLEAVE